MPQPAQNLAGYAAAVLTRPAGRNETLAQQLTARGVHCVALPALELIPVVDPAPPPQGFDLILFVSGFAAQCYLRGLQDARWPADVLAAGVGPGTLQAIRASGCVPLHTMIGPSADSQQDSEALWQTLQTALVSPKRVLIVRGNAGRDWLRRQWQNAGADVQDFVAYHRRAALWPTAAGQILRDAATYKPCVLLVTSAQSARAMDENLRRLDLTYLWGQCRILTLHPRIADCVERLRQAAGIAAQRQVAITKPDAPAVLQAMLALVQD